MNEIRTLTKAKIKRAVSANLKGITTNKLYSGGLTGSCIESPNDTISVNVMVNSKNIFYNGE
jgi:hypothetical protein